MSYESLINELFNRIIRYIKAQPLNLGGYTTISGGAGGPPGGFTGYLPQSRAAFDESEAEIWPIPSGPTLVDNLNRIRYRLSTLEASGVGSSGTWDLVVEDDSVVVLSGVTVLDFTGSLTVTAVGDNKITVSGTASSSVTNLDDLTDVVAPSPTDGDVLTWDSGTSKWINQQPASSGTVVSGTSWDLVVKEDGIIVVSGVTEINFTGDLSVTNNGGNSITVSGISSVASSGVGHTIQDEGISLTQRTNLNFVGTGVTVTDDSINNATVVTISISGTTISGLGEILTDNSILVDSVWVEDDLTSQVPTSIFTVTSGYVAGSLKIYYNGIRQRKSNFTENAPTSFTTLFNTYSGDSMLAEYRASGVSECTILFDDNGDVIYEY